MREAVFHGVTGRLLERLQAERPRWSSAALVSALRDAQRDAFRAVRTQLEDAVALARSLPPANPPLVLKGATAYALTGRAAALRASADVDVLVAPPDRAASALGALGYDLLDGRAPHEAFVARRGEVWIDVHDHFPAFRYESDLAAATLEPALNPGVWRTSGTLVAGKIPYRLLARSSVRGRTRATAGVRFAGSEAAVLVACCHLLQSYHFSAAFPKIRLGELADVVDLVSQPGFSRDRFTRLVSAVSARDAVAHARWLVENALGVEPERLERLAVPPVTRPFPQDLWWADGSGGFLVRTDPVVGVDDLVRRRLRVGRLARYLGANRATAGRPGERSSWRMLVSGSGGPLRFAFRARASRAALDVSVRLDAPREGARHAVLVNLGRIVVECTSTSGGGMTVEGATPSGRLESGDVEASASARGDSISVRVPLAGLGARPAGPRYALLGVRRSLPAGPPDASVLLPLELGRAV